MTYITSPSELVYDEVYGAFGKPRMHQRLLLEHLGMAAAEDLRGAALTERLAGVRRRIRERLSEQEVSYNILGAPEGSQRPWDLDVLPWVLDPDEFEVLAEGLRQRARLIEAVLQDLYGEQRLVTRGLVPPQVCLGNPNFFRACHGWQPLGSRRLHVYAADVARAPNGQFVVFSDRTAAPTGSGYALENRLVMGRVHEQAFRAYPVRKLNTFFQALRTTLDELAPPRGTAFGPPRMVVLSAGAQDESSFEHAYLARYFGVELVEGRDLTVRDDAVYVKTLGGLRRVDVILRRVLDHYCDPLELREGALGGVPGLVGAARSGQVAIANPLGSGLLESAAFAALLPELAREVLGEELRLPSVPTWWCGRAPDLAYVLEHLDELVIKPAFDERRAPPIEPGALAAVERAEWVARLRSKPGEFVAQKWPQRSVGPYWTPDGVARGHLALRLFLCRSSDDFTAMPGGLARVASSPDGLFLFVAGEQGSKDVWVPAVGPATPSLLPSMPERDVPAQPGNDDLPSRLLDDLFWLGRSLERVDNIARVVRHGVDRAGDEVSWAGVDVELCVELLRLLEVLPSSKVARVPEESLSDRVLELLRALNGPQLDNDLLAALRAVRGLTQRVRSRLSRDVWYALRQVSALAEELTEGKHEEDPARWVDGLLLRTAAVSGGLLENMVRGSAWSFVEMGRRMERGAFVLGLLATFLPGAGDRSQLEAVLEITDSLLSYRARHLSQLQAEHVVHLLLTDDTNPHSVSFQLVRIHEELERVRAVTGASESPEVDAIDALRRSLRARSSRELCAGAAAPLGAAARSWLQRMWDFSDALTERYFSHAAGELYSDGAVWVDENLEARHP